MAKVLGYVCCCSKCSGILEGATSSNLPTKYLAPASVGKSVSARRISPPSLPAELRCLTKAHATWWPSPTRVWWTESLLDFAEGNKTLTGPNTSLGQNQPALVDGFVAPRPWADPAWSQQPLREAHLRSDESDLAFALGAYIFYWR